MSMRRSPALFLFVILAAAAPVMAQVASRPTDQPIVTADNERWYVNGDPIQFAGDDYYQAGATTFFNGNQMVRSGNFGGVPLYTDTTLEPYSIVYVPLSRGLMQPYERVRQGSLAGTTGSRTPSFPVRVAPTSAGPLEAAAAPTAPPAPVGDVGEGFPAPVTTAGTYAPAPVGTSGVIPVIPRPTAVATAEPPRGNEGVWIAYLGEKWISAGAAVPLTAGDFRVVGTYAGFFPVFARRDSVDQVIYLPTRAGLVAPYRLRQ
jgi:hypothetical protein